jgi:hypothetical protein
VRPDGDVDDADAERGAVAERPTTPAATTPSAALSRSVRLLSSLDGTYQPPSSYHSQPERTANPPSAREWRLHQTLCFSPSISLPSLHTNRDATGVVLFSSAK